MAYFFFSTLVCLSIHSFVGTFVTLCTLSVGHIEVTIPTETVPFAHFVKSKILPELKLFKLFQAF